MNVIVSRYQIEEKIGAGGMGMVYRGLDTATGLTVAVKHLKTDVIDPSMVERFQCEGEALRQLNHPNIVKMLTAVNEGEDHYLMMEYIPGGDLNGLLKQGLLPIHRVIEIALDVADALTRAHRLNIIHRDLKPANVLLAEDSTPRLSDFGIARIGAKERITQTNGAVGTLDYIPPEVLRGEVADARSDIWSFGVMLFEMITGRRPFPGESVGQVVHEIMNTPVPDIEAMRPDMPVELADLIYRMLDKDRAMRISSVRLVGAELEAILTADREGHDTVIVRDIKPAPRFHDTSSSFITYNNLPVPTTPFIGRENELAQIAAILNDPAVRLATIVAPGGMGKTRLSIEAAQRELMRYPDGVYFIELAPITSADAIIPTLADAIGFKGSPNDPRPFIAQIGDYLGGRSMLLVMDNFEHVLDGAGLITTLLQAAPLIKILVTSRQRLNQSGETVYALEGMDFADWRTVEEALDYSVVQLFLQSARRTRPDFELHTDYLPHIARICRTVDGMPLGIVLAAAWLEMLTPAEIAEEMNIDFLETEMGDIPARQRSIRAVMDYTWNLLAENEREPFMKMSVFRGGFTREAAQHVTGANLRVLMALNNKSLIRRDADTGRYSIHGLLSQYAGDKLKETGLADAAYESHARYFANFSDDEMFSSDFENIRAAWQWAVHHDLDLLDSMVEKIHKSTRTLVRHVDGKQMFDYAREHIPPHSTHRAQRRVMVRYIEHLPDFVERLQNAIDLARAANDLEELGHNLFFTFVMQSTFRQYEIAFKTVEEVIEIFTRINDPVHVALCHLYMASAYLSMGNFDAAWQRADLAEK